MLLGSSNFRPPESPKYSLYLIDTLNLIGTSNLRYTYSRKKNEKIRNISNLGYIL